MSWTQVYDAATESVIGDGAFHLAAVPVLILFAWFEYRRGRPKAAIMPLAIAVAFLSVSALVVAMRSRAIASVDDCVWAEGPVRVVSAERYGGHGPKEAILVGDTRVTFSFFTVEVGYRQTIARGGELQEGRLARVCLLQGRMMRVLVGGE